MASYGLPYQGSKNQIADWVVKHLPSANTLVDLFCGGCAVTHAALITGRWSNYIINDIHGDVPQLFVDAINGKYTTENCTKWISREEFHKKKNTDAYIGLCWSFKNDRDSYVYGKGIEEPKHLLHNIVFGSTVTDRMQAVRDFLRWLKKQSDERYAEFLKQMQRGRDLQTLQNLQRVERPKELEGLIRQQDLNALLRIESLQRLQRLQGLQGLQGLRVSGKDYREVELPPPIECVIYCDIPYGSEPQHYNVSFDKQSFLDWAAAQSAPIIISEYNISDSRFEVLDEISKLQLSDAKNNSRRVIERLYVPKNQIKTIRERLENEGLG